MQGQSGENYVLRLSILTILRPIMILMTISTVDSTTTKETLFSRADEALYSVKEGGRNNDCIYEE